jgi:hypothetical protein
MNGAVLVSARAPAAARLHRPALVAVAAAAVAALFALRLRSMHQGLLYPDGYQYLLMARGIGEHLQPVATLGPGGDTLAPSADAAAKPLFPALVAIVEAAGLSPLEAARIVAAAGAAAVAPLAGLVAVRLGGTRWSALLAGLLCLFGPSLVFWSGFAGADALAEALALAAALALLARRPALGGVLAGLCVLTRPELSALWLAAALAAGASPRTRAFAVRASTAALLTLAVVVGVLRPPLSGSTPALLAAGVAGGAALAVLLVWAGRASARAASFALAGLALLLGYALAAGSGWSAFAGHEWPLLVLAGLALALAVRSPGARATALRIALFVVALGAVYWWKNPGSERYAAVLVPALAVLAGLGLRRLPPLALIAGGAAAVAAALVTQMPSVGPDGFPAVAAALRQAPPGPIVTAAPDAYGVLLPDRAIRVMRPGASGLVLVDGAARAYEPGLRVVGKLLRRIPSGPGFLRPDGRLDESPALLYRGSVRRAG